MVFDSKKVVYTAENNWDELVSITFVDNDNYLSLSSLIYEDEIEVELNDQVNYVSVDKSNFRFELTETALHVILDKVIVQNNFPALKFVVNYQVSNSDKLTRAMDALIRK